MEHHFDNDISRYDQNNNNDPFHILQDLSAINLILSFIVSTGSSVAVRTVFGVKRDDAAAVTALLGSIIRTLSLP